MRHIMEDTSQGWWQLDSLLKSLWTVVTLLLCL